MYPTSQAYKTAIKNSIIEYDIVGEIDGLSITNLSVLKGSLSITNRCSNNNEINIGSVYVGELNVVLLRDLNHYAIVGKEISFTCLVKAGNTYEPIPLGRFTVAEATKTKNGTKIKAYDNMSKLDKPFSGQVEGTAYEIANFACAQCGLDLANSNFDNFVNSIQTLSIYPGSDIETYRDLIFWLAQTVGCFATANREGEIEFRKYNTTVVDTLDTDVRFNDGSFADYETFYTSLTAVNMENGEEQIYQLSVDNGLTYELGENPFLQYNDYNSARENVLSAISSFHYVPFSIQSAANPAYDLGDVISLPNGLGDANKLFCITQITWKYNGSVSISGGGKNPQLLTVKSKTEKRINSVSKSKSDKDIIQYYSFTNAVDITIADGETEKIIDIRYTAVKATVAIFLAEILCEIETTASGINFYDGVAEFYCYIDSELVERLPVETWADGNHIKHILDYLSTTAGTAHRLQIRCKMTGGEAFIPMGAIKACIYGQNLVASDDWRGIIEIEEDAPDWNLEEIDFESVIDPQLEARLNAQTNVLEIKEEE